MDPARSIDEVLERLDGIIKRSRMRETADGYFATLYRAVTAEVKDRIARGFFDDGPRMERLDVVFANRYLEAWGRHEAGESAGRAWEVAFGSTRAFWPVVLQHLLLGINAHINLDLGAAAAAVAPGRAIDALEADFGRVNGVLADLVDDVQARLGRIWPALRWLDGFAGGADEAVVNFSLLRARENAWRLARTLAACASDEARAPEMERADAVAEKIGRLVLRPGFGPGLALKVIRLRERGDVASKLAVLGA